MGYMTVPTEKINDLAGALFEMGPRNLKPLLEFERRVAFSQLCVEENELDKRKKQRLLIAVNNLAWDVNESASSLNDIRENHPQSAVLSDLNLLIELLIIFPEFVNHVRKKYPAVFAEVNVATMGLLYPTKTSLDSDVHSWKKYVPSFNAKLEKAENTESPEDLAEKGYSLHHSRAFDV